MVIEPPPPLVIGFVAKEFAAEIAPLMDEGTEFWCVTGDILSQNSFILLISDEGALDDMPEDDEPLPAEPYLDN